MILPRKQLPVQSQQLQHKIKVLKLLKIKNEENRKTSMASSHFILLINFELANVWRVNIKRQTLLKKIFVMLQYFLSNNKQHLNLYTMTTLRVNQ